MSEAVLNKKLVRLNLRFGDIDWERATVKQYELEKEEAVWRIFLNGYARNGFVVFDPSVLSEDKILEALEGLQPEVKSREELTVAELIERSMSWNNVMKNAKA
ncbi:DUF3213 domain-containing protein [Thermococcus sp. AM4]|uniref:DUF3213 domain-containing protein n=1 Tax=Thermococcus sp. (strain AM4) TaxID=246969 RepID=UPI0001870B4D|nr:DUF3213 domain-containing protein [Thermococcus sp. AM4]EEB73777.1 conserved hypothetical protein [Thermococcus sp. AM4]